MTQSIANKRLLVVEDDPQFRFILCRELRELGYAVTEADDGLEAVRLVKAHDCGYFDCVVTDYQMSGLTGGEAINLIQQQCPDQPVLYVSGRELPPDLSDHEAYLMKPVLPHQVADAVEMLIRSRASTIPPGEP